MSEQCEKTKTWETCRTIWPKLPIKWCSVCTKANDSLDTEYTDEVVCPHCGQTQSDPWEIFEGKECSETECGSCVEPFLASQHVSVSYSTRKPEEDT